MTESVYNVGKARLIRALTDADGSDLRVAIIIGSTTGASNPDLATMAAIDALASVDFHSERVALASLVVTQNDTSDRAEADAANVTYAAAPGVTARAAVVYDHAGGANDGVRFPISYHDTGFPQPMDGGLTLNVADWLRAV